ncbi:DUF819 family protein [Neolewinella lacunae]|uniref:DUF819 family protein n=1 Tax=Neolewinella lacunae TaxID=1517758 RepID=A0A923PKA5_9BACT|nr:DUF819 family protein [Neolewinella lacunae]MBC6994919.1 DUF819 family protein [Neolewinella lacunae]MDN3633502.1 DUF819 family protein [Neolewinella lacunae]
MADLLSLGLCVGFPLLARYGERQGIFPAWLSSIIACYLIGIAVGNARLWATNKELLEATAGAAMLIGLPLLLFAVRVRESLRYARRMLFAFALCCLAGLLCTAVVGWWLSPQLENAWKVSGMLVGLYTGGTPNVQAIALALDAPPDYVVLVQAADVLLGGSYLLGLVTFLPAVYSRFFPASESNGAAEQTDLLERVAFPKQMAQLALALLTTALSAGVCYLLTGGLDNLTLLILLLTSISLVVAGSSLAEKIGNSYPVGEYFILVFCVALGLLADFRELASNGMDLLYFSALALSTTTVLHLLLCRAFGIDRDTTILSSVAGFYGPVFVVQVATALKNQRLLAAGVAVSLLGFGIGNYLGIGLAYLVRWLGAE